MGWGWREREMGKKEEEGKGVRPAAASECLTQREESTGLEGRKSWGVV